MTRLNPSTKPLEVHRRYLSVLVRVIICAVLTILPAVIASGCTKADFEVSNLIVNPQEVETDQAASISVSVRNTGGAEGTCTVTLMVDGPGGTLTDQQQVTVIPEYSKDISFIVSENEPGTYSINVNGLKATLIVLESLRPTEFQFSNLVISPMEITAGKSCVVLVNVNNVGETEGVCEVRLSVEDEDTDIRNVTVGAGSTKTVTFVLVESHAGTYRIDINGLSGTLVVKAESTVEPPLPSEPTDDTLAVGTLSLTPTLECIGVVSYYTGDNNQNNNVVLEFRRVGTSTWQTAPEMYADREGNQCRGSIFWLTPDTDYQVRVTYFDADGVFGSPVEATVRTRDDNPPSNGNTYYVATSGNDSNPGTEAEPFRTIQKAANIVYAGDTVLIKAGTYVERVQIRGSGTMDNYITFRPYGTDTVVLDGNGILTNLFHVSGATCIRIKGLTIKNSSNSSAIYVTDSDYIIIEDNIIIDPNTAGEGTQGGVRICHGAENCIIQRNTISVNAGPPGVRGTIFGIVWWRAGGGHVIRDNVITSTTGALRDGMGGGPEDTSEYMNNVDIYNNVIVGAEDDGIQPEGGNVNVRLWNNRIKDSFIGFAMTPTLKGPLYVFRNVITGSTSAAFKLGDSSFGRIYLYHNTYYTNQSADGYKQTNPDLGNIVSRNNIIRSGRYIFEIGGPNFDFDYDSLYTTDGARFVKWTNSTMYISLESFVSGTGQELHGISEADNRFVDVASDDFRLSAGSPCIDAGVILPGFNDAHSPWPYQGSAPDIGAFEQD